MAVKMYRCKNCGAKLEWVPDKGKWVCEFCDHAYTLDDFKTEEDITNNENKEYEHGKIAQEGEVSTDDTNVNPEDLRVYKCKYCSSEIITDKTTMATSCVFCGNPVVLEEQLATDFKPKWVIPFKVKQDKVRDIYLEYIKKPFVPNEFLSDRHIEKIKGVYIPFWLYDIEADGRVVAEGDKTSHRSDSRYDYTTHSIYDIVRSGKINFDKLPVDASSKTPDDAMDSIDPFDYKELTKFEMPYLAGFLAERYDQTKEECKERADVRAKNSAVNILKNTITGYSSVSVRSSDATLKHKNTEYALLPTYMLYSKFDGKDYLFALNGQTGKACGNVPIDKSKVVTFALTRFAGIFAISSIITFIATLFI